MLTAVYGLSGLGNVLGCDVADDVCLEVACGSGMDVNPNVSMRQSAPCVPQCGAGQILNTSTLTCMPDPQVTNALSVIDASGGGGVATSAGSAFGPSAAGGAVAALPKLSWKWIVGGLVLLGIGALAWHYHASRSPAPAAS